MNIEEIFAAFIENTAPQILVPTRDVFLCSIDPDVHAVLKDQTYFLNPRSYISTISIKHAYDRRPLSTRKLIRIVEETMRQPDLILADTEKKGDFIFVKRLVKGKNKFLCCPAEICMRESGYLCLKCVTFFPTKSRSYLQKFPTVWDREGGLLLHRDVALARNAQQ